ncbi:MAG: chorismate synthase, partial [Coriobacteriia bacterium]
IRSGTGVLRRATNRAGGLEGGMTNGEPLVIRSAMKPIPTLMRPLKTIDIATGETADAARERSDVCAVPAAAVVAEAEVALVLADAYQDLFGHGPLEDVLRSLGAYRARIGW